MNRFKRMLATGFGLSACFLVAAFANNKPTASAQSFLPDTVRINSGFISGTATTDGAIHVFKGIPFAAPPVGNLRWKAPLPAAKWNGVKQCAAFGPSPMQAAPAPFSMWSEEFLIPKEPISEDCLYLNVWSGAKANAKKPVLVWIYGGGFASGGSAVPIYDGEAMARKGIVFVSINYRVGVFGFLAHPELTKESPNHASGNYGLLDQIAALKWVRQNIEAFGGDAKNVTIAGQSAGSMSVNCLVASPLAHGLFQKAIAESGANFLRGNSSLQDAENGGEKWVRDAGATSIAQLRKLPAADLQQKAGGMRGPIVDGYVLPQSIAEIFAAGKQNNVLLLTGWNEEEGLMFGPPKDAAGFRKQAAEQYGADSTAFLKFYPATSDSIANRSQLYLSRDQIFGAQNYTWANVQTAQGKPVYVYRFTRKVPATGEYKKYGAFHTGEVPYAYDNLKFVNRPWLDSDRELARVMSGYWANFIATGNPNGAGLPPWPAYTASEKQVMVLDEKQEAKPMADAASLDFTSSKMSGK